MPDDATNGGRRAYDACRSGSGAERGVRPHSHSLEKRKHYKKYSDYECGGRLARENQIVSKLCRLGLEFVREEVTSCLADKFFANLLSVFSVAFSILGAVCC